MIIKVIAYKYIIIYKDTSREKTTVLTALKKNVNK